MFFSPEIDYRFEKKNDYFLLLNFLLLNISNAVPALCMCLTCMQTDGRDVWSADGIVFLTVCMHCLIAHGKC